jgi:outer membrane protein assembly factor BamD (BamD/ComL family)
MRLFLKSNFKKIVIIFIIFSGCSSMPKEIPADMQPDEFFKNAQNAVAEWGRYNVALFYYQEFLKRFPDLDNKILEAEYEIAFIHYKQKNYKEAKTGFTQVLDKYKNPNNYPDWPKKLSEKILKQIEEEEIF